MGGRNFHLRVNLRLLHGFYRGLLSSASVDVMPWQVILRAADSPKDYDYQDGKALVPWHWVGLGIFSTLNSSPKRQKGHRVLPP